MRRKVKEAAKELDIAFSPADDSSAAFAGLMEYYKEKKRYYNLGVVCPKPLLCFGSQDYKPTPRAVFIYVVFTGLLCITYLYMKINAPGFSTVFGDSTNLA